MLQSGRINVLQEDAHKTTPLTAALKAFQALAVRRIGLVTPYIGEVNQILINYIEAAGDYKVTSLLSFNLGKDSEVASVTVESIKSAAIIMGMQDQVDLGNHGVLGVHLVQGCLQDLPDKSFSGLCLCLIPTPEINQQRHFMAGVN